MAPNFLWLGRRGGGACDVNMYVCMYVCVFVWMYGRRLVRELGEYAEHAGTPGFGSSRDHHFYLINQPNCVKNRFVSVCGRLLLCY